MMSESPGTSIEEARAARATSDANLRHAQLRDPSVREAADRLRDLRRQNHFAATLAAAMHRRG